MTHELKVLLVDDHQILREGLKALLEMTQVRVVATAGSAEEALAELEGRSVDVVISDLSLPGKSGLWLIEQLKEKAPSIPVLILSVSDESDHVLSALRLGASGYLTKTVGSEELAKAIQTVHQGEAYLQPRLSSLMVKSLQERETSSPPRPLGDRERELLQYLYLGLSNKQLSEKLCVSLSTIKAQLRSLFRKFEVTSRTELVVSALKAGVIEEN